MSLAPAPYSDEQIAIIAERLRAGDSATEIAAYLPGKTRNAIIGLVHRNKTLNAIGFARKGGDGRKRGTHSMYVRPSRAKPRDQWVLTTPKYRKPAWFDSVPKDAPEPKMISTIDLRDGVCRWPVGDPLMEGFGYCGHDAVGHAYCGFHCRLAYGGSSK